MRVDLKLKTKAGILGLLLWMAWPAIVLSGDDLLLKATLKKDRLLFVSVRDLQKQQRLKKAPLLVDVRTKKEFEQTHLTGALNIPLHHVKTKAFLKKRPFVMMDQGYRIRTLSVECRRLRRQGFHASILDGGLAAWRAAGLPLEGDFFAAKALSQVRPRDVFGEGRRNDQVVVDVSATPRSEKYDYFPLHESLSPKKSISAIVAEHKDAPSQTWLIIDGEGKNPGIVNKFHTLGLHQVFYLRGGIKGFGRYLAQHQAALAPRSSRIYTTKPCTGCADTNIDAKIN